MTSASDETVPEPATETSSPRSPRKGLLIGAIVAGSLLVLAGIGVGVVISLQNTTYSPVNAVTGYTDDIEAGRFADAWSATTASTGASTALVDAGQVELSTAISDVTLGEPTGGGDTRTIPVTYDLDGVDGTGTIVVRSVGKQMLFFDEWQIESGLESHAEITSTGLDEVMVGGVPVALSSESVQIAAYPGTYPVSGPESDWITVTAEPLAVTADGGTTAVALSASDALQGEVESQVNAQLDTCAASTSAAPEGCPFRILAWNGASSVKWTIKAYPTIELTGYESFTGSAGRVTATFRESGAARSSTQSFSVSGAIEIDGDTVTAQMQGY